MFNTLFSITSRVSLSNDFLADCFVALESPTSEAPIMLLFMSGANKGGEEGVLRLISVILSILIMLVNTYEVVQCTSYCSQLLLWYNPLRPSACTINAPHYTASQSMATVSTTCISDW